MTPDAIERLVSETVEPMPVKSPEFQRESPLGAWLWNWVSPAHWQPAPWLTDDRYAMRLFDEMVIERGWDRTCEAVWREPGIPGEYRVNFTASRRMATVTAWLKWKGVPSEG